ncbi:MAG TPA: type II secretion system F family protein [Candidatus Binatia bacterium]|nr:type II secretion system F family protein [Candidatus Binatia bacterium]
MVNTLILGAIFVGISATAFFFFFAFWGSVNKRATARVNSLGDQLERAGIQMSSQEIVLSLSAAIAIVWIVLVLLLHPPLVMALILLPLVAAVGVFGFYTFVQIKIARRLNAFIEQLESALRLIASSVRVGLGLRQALALVVEELPDPARYEFQRVIGQANIGASIFDALDTLAVRMPCNESLMVARVFRVQAETGGDLARILEQLADTIKGRRQVHRKIATLTAEGRLSAWVLMLIPVGLGVFIWVTQPDMSHALFFTGLGHIVLLIIAIFEVVGFVWVRKILQVDV